MMAVDFFQSEAVKYCISSQCRQGTQNKVVYLGASVPQCVSANHEMQQGPQLGFSQRMRIVAPIQKI